MPDWRKGTMVRPVHRQHSHGNQKVLVVVRPVHSKNLRARNHLNPARVINRISNRTGIQAPGREDLHHRDQVASGRFSTPQQKMAKLLRTPRGAASSTSGTLPLTRPYDLRRHVGTSWPILKGLSRRAWKPSRIGGRSSATSWQRG